MSEPTEAEAEPPLPRRAGGTPPRDALPWLLVGGAGGVVVGGIVAHSTDALPPMGEFIVSPGFAGSIAFIGASIAAWVAWFNSREDRLERQAADARDRWWERFSWATDRAFDASTTEAGVLVLNSLVSPGLATSADARMAVEILELIGDPADDERSDDGDGDEIQS